MIGKKIVGVGMTVKVKGKKKTDSTKHYFKREFSLAILIWVNLLPFIISFYFFFISSVYFIVFVALI